VLFYVYFNGKNNKKKMKNKPTALIILDGFGWSKSEQNNPIAIAHKPTFDYLITNYPWSTLKASGEYVGLTKNSMGNSQVGHFTIGAGKIVQQPLTIVNNFIEDNSFYKNAVLNNCLQKLDNSENSLHIIGLLSDAGVHAHEKHLYAFLQSAVKYNIKNIYLHIILDGIDMAEKFTFIHMQKLQDFIDQYKHVHISSIHGRSNIMVKNLNWQQLKETFNGILKDQEIKFKDWQEALKYYHQQNIPDDLIPSTQLLQNSIVKNDDGIIFFNFRPDRAKQLVKLITEHINLKFFLTLFNLNNNKTSYMFEFPVVKENLLKILSDRNYTIYSIAETEKYAHVTYFFKCFEELKLKNETEILVPSLELKNYSNHPEMSAKEITSQIILSLEKGPKDFYLINYANADMVGHSGDFNATVKAIECLDKQLEILYQEFVIKRNGTLYITADHGNAELKFKDKSNKSHTTNPVPFIFVRSDLKNENIKMHLNQLADIKDFILKNIP